MTPRYSATRTAKNIIVYAQYEDGRQEVLAILQIKDGVSMISDKEKLLLVSPEYSYRDTETSLFACSGHNVSDILGAVADCLVNDTRRRKKKLRGIIYCAVSLALGALIASCVFLTRVPVPFNQSPASATSQVLPAQNPVDDDIQASVSASRRPLPAALENIPQVNNKPGKTILQATATKKETPEATKARHNLATVLKRNADRGMFTVNLSSGHERTLYAFLNPRCPNCRALEPALKRLSADFNVVVYPVSVIGGDKSASHMAPLLCEKDPQKRAEGWHHLYSADAGMMVPGSTEALPDKTCLKAARAAIDVNNLAFRQFGFAGTPWVLSDTGWHLPTGLLQESGTVKFFLKTTDSESDHE
ncbi:TPA: DsbC family protein [Salmonella enterica]|uniref:DsbC family protein n=1 Tax=unclassified Salmonella TaxID=2614656 RepID=UPI0015823126|nr:MULTISPECIES: DsbC family protein [unclassified Salmonella]HAK3505531.1 DsbC family protein [Salmonella enterica]HDN4533946.1 DsbC family protein [Salmonella enterica subsp. enterica serovar Emmastad]